MTAVVVLADGTARVELVPATGGAIATFTAGGRPVLRPTPADVVDAGDVRGHACYPLVPYSNRIDHGRLVFGARAHQLDLNFGDHPHAIHGVGWQRPWTVLEHDGTSALIAYDHRPAASGEAGGGPAAADARAWPWPFRATQWFAVKDLGADGVVLRTRLSIANTGREPFPFGLGWHPFFPRDAHTVLGFAADGTWLTDATIMPTEHVPVAGEFRFDPPRSIGATAMDNVFTGWHGLAQLVDPRTGWTTIMRGDTATPFFVCYIPRQGAYLAIEPVTHMTDGFNRAERGERATGTRVLAPGQSFSATMELLAGARP